jgi:peptidyl-prolyl cis-trans isomerase B (cyclophilin B)
MKHILCLITLLITTTGFCAMNNTEPIVEMKTSMGTIELQLNAEKTPATVKNFLSYVNSGFYDGTIFHRVIKNFMIQGGGFTENMQQKKANASIKNEADNGLKNDKYTIAMARTNDPNSATCQFFINTKDNDFLNYTAPNARGWGYAVFGKVIKGQDVVDKIQDVKTGSKNGMGDVPTTPVIIEKMTVVKAEPKAEKK